ncbi:MAG TPA: trypsin-like serine protease [Candidatus Kapabacteria bacterium]
MPGRAMKHWRVAILLIAWIFVFAGRGRHDVPLSKYYELAAQHQFDCVGELLANKPYPGSGVLIDSEDVLTAAHCVMESTGHLDTIKSGGYTMTVNVDDSTYIGSPQSYSFRFGDQIYHGVKITVHPKYNHLIANQFDLAIVKLDRPVKNVDLPHLCENHDELGAIVVGVGFGPGGPADTPEVKNPIRKFAGENVIDSMSRPDEFGLPTLMLCDMDHPTDSSCNKTVSKIPRPLEYIASGGDSGGGLFRLKNGKWELIGILTGGGINIDQFKRTGYYGQIMKWTRLSTFQSWISSSL